MSLNQEAVQDVHPHPHDEHPFREGDDGIGLFHRIKTHLQSQYKILLTGQVLSFFFSVTGAAQTTLCFDCSLTAPAFTMGCFFFALVFCLIPVYLEANNARKGVNHHLPISQSDDVGEEHRSASETDDNDSVLCPDVSSVSIAQVDDVISSSQYTFLGVIPLHNAVWKYILMALLDVYSNYFTFLAFSYTTITSVTLFDSLAIPSAMVLSSLLLSRKYTKLHLLGVFICSIGILLNVFLDYEHDRPGGLSSDVNQIESEQSDVYSHKLFGDILAIVGGVLFGMNNTVCEVAVRGDGGPNEYLGMIGVFASCICAIHSLIFERDEVLEFFDPNAAGKSPTCKESTARLVLVAFFFSSILCYLGSSRFLQVSESCLYNLSLLTGILWSVVFSVFAQRIVPSPLFFVAMVFIISGVILYEMAPSPMEDTHDENQLFIRGDEKHVTLHNMNRNDSHRVNCTKAQAAHMISCNPCLERVDDAEPTLLDEMELTPIN